MVNDGTGPALRRYAVRPVLVYTGPLNARAAVTAALSITPAPCIPSGSKVGQDPGPTAARLPVPRIKNPVTLAIGRTLRRAGFVLMGGGPGFRPSIKHPRGTLAGRMHGASVS